jgi:hypothetical protein
LRRKRIVTRRLGTEILGLGAQCFKRPAARCLVMFVSDRAPVGIRWRVPTIRQGRIPFLSKSKRQGRDTFEKSAASWGLTASSAGMTSMAWPSEMGLAVPQVPAP